MSTPDDDLVAALSSWDGQSASDIAAVYARFHPTPGFINALVRSCHAGRTERAATWLIKHHLEQSRTGLRAETRAQYYRCVGTLTHWEAKLHVAQCLDFIPVPSSEADTVWLFAQDASTSDRKLLRALGLYGLARLAHQFPKFKPDAEDALQKAARQNPKGAIAVRLRKARALLTSP